jgi:hypothetical protein
MSAESSSQRQQETVKLSVTVKSHLEDKYKKKPGALQEIDEAIKDWIKADSNRGIRTVHVALDDPADMNPLGATPISGKATAPRIKRAIDDLWKRLNPQYLVLFGAKDIVPMFEVWNPAYDQNGDDDEKVPTDNPYASSKRFRSSRRIGYLVPDRVIGRIPDMVSDSDPAWFVEYLKKTACTWTAQPASFYARQLYAICSQECEGAGLDCMRYIRRPEADLLISPPIEDSLPAAKQRLSAPLHMIKCHGNEKDAAFWGYQNVDQKNNQEAWKQAVTSATLKECLQPGTVVATMCCFGAEIFLPKDADSWPLASTYLRKGAFGFVGSTKKAWGGFPSEKNWSDWIAGGYLKNVLQGSSIGRAFLDSKIDYACAIIDQGKALDLADEKTLIEYVLLGDPTIHPVGSKEPPKTLLPAEERRQRRVVRQRLAEGLRILLPERRPVKKAAETKTAEEEAAAKKMFDRAKTELGEEAVKNLETFSIEPTAFRVEKVDTALDKHGDTRQSLEYYWTGQRDRDGHKQICLVKAEIDRNGEFSGATVVYSS